MFEFLFKLPVETWRQGELFFASGWPPSWFVAAFLVTLALLVASTWRLPLSVPRRVAILTLQSLVWLVALTMLWQPALRTESVKPGENTVALLIDDSASMAVADEGERSRLDAARQLVTDYLDEADPLFDHVLYGVGDHLAPLEGDTADALTGEAPLTAIGDALDELLGTIGERSLAAVVLLSDGADNARRPDSRWWQRLRSAGVPVHTVGFGADAAQQDVEIVNVAMPARAAPDSPVTARVTLRHSAGFGPVRLRITQGDELLLADDLELPAEPGESLHAVTFNSGDAGVSELRIAVASERVAESNLVNNVQHRVLVVGDERRRVLYVEGEPRWEYKFLRRALYDSPLVELVSLLRTSPNKYYRQGVRDADELADGFPRTREALFAYDAVIIGSFEAAMLSSSQQADLRDFVSVRGGSLLMLGGQAGLDDGGWGRSALASALPVSFGSTATGYERSRVTASLTGQGLRTDWLRLDDDEAANLAAWQGLPELADVHVVGQPKPGAVTLLTAGAERGAVPLLVWQRYGQGSSYVLATGGTWRWQMRLPSDDLRHERFWQQLVTRLVGDSLPRYVFESAGDVVRDRDAMPFVLTARNADYTPATRELALQVQRPDGRVEDVALVADPNQGGRFTGSVPIDGDGPYGLVPRIDGSTDAAHEHLAASLARHWWFAESGTAEYFDNFRHGAFLQRIATETGGRYLASADADELRRVLGADNAALTEELVTPLWNLPLFFLLLLLGKGLEWLLRLRWKRL